MLLLCYVEQVKPQYSSQNAQLICLDSTNQIGTCFLSGQGPVRRFNKLLTKGKGLKQKLNSSVRTFVYL
jgi:hypothetical protein